MTDYGPASYLYAGLRRVAWSSGRPPLPDCLFSNACLYRMSFHLFVSTSASCSQMKLIRPHRKSKQPTRYLEKYYHIGLSERSKAITCTWEIDVTVEKIISDSQMLEESTPRSPTMTCTSSSSSYIRYVLRSCGDQYIRWPVPGFSGHQYIFGNDTEPTSKSAHKVQSVIENVQMLEKALQEQTVGQEPFGEAWQNATMAYADDLERRVRPLIFGNNPTAIFRNSIMKMAKDVALSELRDFVIKRSIGQVTHGHGWVLFLLENRLGEMLRQNHELLPEDGGNYDEEFAHQLLEEAHDSFESDKSAATSSIEQIHSSRRLDQAVQFFDMEGGEFEIKRQGLLPKEAGSAVNSSRVPGDHNSYPDLLNCLQGNTRSISSHDVIIILDEKKWEMASTGLGAGYISWTIKDLDSSHYLLGFSPL